MVVNTPLPPVTVTGPRFCQFGGAREAVPHSVACVAFGAVKGNCTWPSGSRWMNASDRNLKQSFAPVDAQAVLDKVAALPVQTWSYKAQPGQTHLGPMAQDFRAAFGLGADDVSIATVDESGVALAAIQGLNRKLEEGLEPPYVGCYAFLDTL